MGFVVRAVIAPICFFMLSRFLNAKINYYMSIKETQKNKNSTFYKLGAIRYTFISIFCKESNVSKKVVVYACTSIINTICMILASVISKYFNIVRVEVIFWAIGLILLILQLVSVNFNDKTVWTIWGGKK